MTRKEVTAAIIQKDNSVLLARRAKGQKLECYWEFPGGKAEKGETLFQCIERELFEELGVESIAKGEFARSIYDYEFGQIELIGINVELQSETFKLEVHDEVKWVEIDKLLEFNLAPADIPLAKELMDER